MSTGHTALLSNLTWKLNFPGRFSKNPQILNFMKVRQVGAELFHADRRTDGRDMKKLIVIFRNSFERA